MKAERLQHLSPRERQIILLRCEGFTYKQIAAQLGLSLNTIKNHMTAVLRKTRALSTIGALMALGMLQGRAILPESGSASASTIRPKR